jgi:hypothetical protein
MKKKTVYRTRLLALPAAGVPAQITKLAGNVSLESSRNPNRKRSKKRKKNYPKLLALSLSPQRDLLFHPILHSSVPASIKTIQFEISRCRSTQDFLCGPAHAERESVHSWNDQHNKIQIKPHTLTVLQFLIF